MNTAHSAPWTLSEVSALVDGELSPADRTRVLALVAHDPEAAEQLAAICAQTEQIRQLNTTLLTESVPESLVAVVRSGQTRQSSANAQSWRWSAMAAGVALAFGAGWLTQSQWSGATVALQAQGRASQEFGRQAALAHVAFAPEVRHPVEVAAADEKHLVQWLSKRLGRPVSVPNLNPLGYELMGGRLLPGTVGARAQFMYQNALGTRLTLYLGAIEPGASGGDALDAQTAFKFGTSGDVSTFYWIDKGFGCAMSGPLSRDALMAVAKAVYQQI